MVVALGLPLKVSTIILGCIFSMLSCGFRLPSLISIPTPTIVALTEFSMLMQWLVSIHYQYRDV